jgi:hypothetical protein
VEFPVPVPFIEVSEAEVVLGVVCLRDLVALVVSTGVLTEPVRGDGTPVLRPEIAAILLAAEPGTLVFEGWFCSSMLENMLELCVLVLELLIPKPAAIYPPSSVEDAEVVFRVLADVCVAISVDKESAVAVIVVPSESKDDEAAGVELAIEAVGGLDKVLFDQLVDKDAFCEAVPPVA